MSQDIPMTEASKRTKSQSTLTMLSNKRAKSPASQQPTPPTAMDTQPLESESTGISEDIGRDSTNLGRNLISSLAMGADLAKEKVVVDFNGNAAAEQQHQMDSMEIQTTDQDQQTPEGSGLLQGTGQMNDHSSVVFVSTDNSISPSSSSPATNRTQGILRNSPTLRSSQVLVTRFQLVMNLTKVSDGMYTAYARQKLLKILSDIRRFDKSVLLLAWERDERVMNPAIEVFNEESPLSSVLTQFIKYVSTFRIPREQQKKEVWAKICLSHSCTAANLIQNIQEVLMTEVWRL